MRGTLIGWQEDVFQAQSIGWPSSQGLRAKQLAFRSTSESRNPSSWMESVLAQAWVSGASESEDAYLLALSNALLDFHISVTEGRSLAEIASYSGLSNNRILELHRSHLEALAAEAWSDGILTNEEISDLQMAAAHMGLTHGEVAHALEATKEVRSVPRKVLLQTGDRVVFTGTLTTPRDEWIGRITSAGLSTGGISKATRLVVSADPDSLSGKAAKARSYGIPVVDERTFQKHFDEYVQAKKVAPH